MKERLVFEKKKGGCNMSGYICDIERLFGDCEETDCDENYHFKLVEESEEIQSEYEWKKERRDILRNFFVKDEKQSDEFRQLTIWLKENKPERWVVCSKENTKVGDEVRTRLSTKAKRIVEYIDRHCDKIVVYDNPHEQSIYEAILAHYEINTYKEED